jgi:hypothetical protein
VAKAPSDQLDGVKGDDDDMHVHHSAYCTLSRGKTPAPTVLKCCTLPPQLHQRTI